ncbi:MAG TPA: (Fe-S)-binding protein [Polyangiaceae bacterium]|nr:(Fe-S)-binding protein [Polyangiaceae bacterium]
MATVAKPNEKSPPRVKLMASCLCDAFFDDVAIATVEVLEHLGCHVEFPEDQTCCGQPAFNSGDWEAARPVARHALRVFQGNDSVVVPSGSCARMLSHGALLLFEGESDSAGARELGQRSFELSDFIVRKLGITRWPGRLDARLAFHRSCHSRGTTYAESALTLLRSIEGLTLVELGEAEQCCGFGGTFSVAFPNISADMGKLKLSHFSATRSEGLISADMGCLLHLSGLAEKRGDPLTARHLAQVLRDALRSSGEVLS